MLDPTHEGSSSMNERNIHEKLKGIVKKGHWSKMHILGRKGQSNICKYWQVGAFGDKTKQNK